MSNMIGFSEKQSAQFSTAERSESESLGELLNRYLSARSGKDKAKLFVRVIEKSKAQSYLTEAADLAFAHIRGCGRRYKRIIPYFGIREYPAYCHHPACYRCDEYDRKRFAEKTVNKIEALFPLRRIDRDQISWVTINYGKFQLGADVQHRKESFKRKLDKLLQRKMPNVAMTGCFQIAIQTNKNFRSGYSGMFHYHCIAVHKKNTRDELDNILRANFDGHRSVHVEPLYDHQNIKDSLFKIISYSSILTVKDYIVGDDAGYMFALYLNSLQSMNSGGRRGFTFSPGFNRLTRKFNKTYEGDLYFIRKLLNPIRYKIILRNRRIKQGCLPFLCIHSKLNYAKRFDLELEKLLGEAVKGYRWIKRYTTMFSTLDGPAFHKRE